MLQIEVLYTHCKITEKKIISSKDNKWYYFLPRYFLIDFPVFLLYIKYIIFNVQIYIVLLTYHGYFSMTFSFKIMLIMEKSCFYNLSQLFLCC